MNDEKQMLNNMIKWRRYLHQNPELSNQEYRTSQWLQTQISDMGNFKITTIGENSFIAEISGKKCGSKEAMAFRADMDALPVKEETGLAFASLNPEVMHACGHDGHMAILLGLADFLAKNRQLFSAKIKLIFQAAEEIPPGGAQEIMDSGKINDVRKIYGFHIFPGHPAGNVGISAGSVTASQDIFKINVSGKGTHGANPEKGIDSILVASEIVSSINHIVSRSISAFENAVVSFGQIHAGSVFNIIPDAAFMEGNLRTTNLNTRETVKKKMIQVAQGVASAYGAFAEIVFEEGYDPVVNDALCAKIAYQAAKKAIGEQNIFSNAQKMVSEDFSVYTKRLKGCFMILGGGEEKLGYAYMNHHPKFDFDERALLSALKVYIQIILDQTEVFV